MFKPLPECRGPALGDMREALVISFNPRARPKAVFAPFGDRQIKRHAHGKIRTEGGIHRQAHCLYADIYRGFRRDDAVQYRSEEHTSELQSLMRISYAVFCLKKKITILTK